MKLRIIVLLLIFLSLPTAAVFAQTPTSTVSMEVVSERCNQTRSYIDRTLKPRDIRARVDRLQAYTYIYQRLDIFVVRMEKNNQIGAKELREDLTRYKNLVDQFKNNYETYDATREVAAASTRCSKSPEDFMNKIASARQARQKIHSDVNEINIMLEQTIKARLQSIHQQLTYVQVGEDKP